MNVSVSSLLGKRKPTIRCSPDMEPARSNPRLERTGAQPARHGRASVGAGRSTAGRWAEAEMPRPRRIDGAQTMASQIECDRIVYEFAKEFLLQLGVDGISPLLLDKYLNPP